MLVIPKFFTIFANELKIYGDMKDMPITSHFSTNRGGITIMKDFEGVFTPQDQLCETACHLDVKELLVS